MRAVAINTTNPASRNAWAITTPAFLSHSHPTGRNGGTSRHHDSAPKHQLQSPKRVIVPTFTCHLDWTRLQYGVYRNQGAMHEPKNAMARSHLRKVERTVDTLRKAREARDEAIREAVESGETLRDVAEAAKMSHQAIHRIARR